MSSDIDDLIGELPSKPSAVAAGDLDRFMQAKAIEREVNDIQSYLKPVTIKFLVRVFGMEHDIVVRRLRKCPIAAHKTHGGKEIPLYHFKDAAQYLVVPKSVNPADYVKVAADFPPTLQKAFWSAQREKQRWQREAGELYNTADVVEVFGEVFIAIKEAARTWVDQLPGAGGLTTEQYETFQNKVTGLLDQIHHSLVELPKHRHTQNLAEQFDESEFDNGDH